MSYNQLLASRIETVLADLEPPKLVSKKMFVGICWITQGNIACGVLQDKLIIRVGKHAYHEALETESDQELHAWVRQGVNLALILPKK